MSPNREPPPTSTQQSPEAPNRPRSAEISWVGLEAGSERPTYVGRSFNSVEQLLQADTADVVVVDGPETASSTALLTLRRHPHYADRILLLGRAAGERAEALADGYAPADAERVQQRWQRWNERLQRLPAWNEATDPMWRVDRWLWLRPQAWITPVRDVSQPCHYSYPLLEAFLNEPGARGLALLESQWKRGHYERGALVDRIRYCRQCESAHLNYVDVCGRCGSLEIGRQPCLHCFICGNVDLQWNYTRNDGLRCPNCLTQLRHIGSDYDRPLENYRCQSCHQLFIDAAVEARCLNCGLSHSTDELRIREFRAFRLSESGRLNRWVGKTSSTQAHRADGADIRLLNEQQFHELLNWQISIYRENKQVFTPSVPAPALIAVQLQNGPERDSEPIQPEQFDAWMDALVAGLADSDRSLRQRDDLIWILRPHCGAAELETVQQQIHDHLQSIQDRDQQPLHWQVRANVLHQALSPDEDAELLLARLLGEINENRTSS